MNSKKVAIVVSDMRSDWTSCRTITSNIIKVYKRIFPKFRLFRIGHSFQSSFQTAWDLYCFSPSKIIFADHKPHPELLIRALRSCYEKNKIPQLVFHIYGDFTLGFQNWKNIEPILCHENIRFICASERQIQLVNSILKQDNLTFLAPFPVDKGRFFWNQALRKQWRKKLSIDENTFVITYTGRMSLQKNVHLLVENFYRFWAKKKIKLLFAGPFDDIGGPMFGVNFLTGTYYQNWKSGIKPCAASKKLRYLGILNSHDLLGLYNASDLFTSLSLYHDEDYGMSPAEALCSGCPAVLSSWGGYETFQMPGSCETVQVRIGQKNLEIANDEFVSHVDKAISTPFDTNSRRKIEMHYHNKLSIESVSKKVKAIHSLSTPVFLGFNKLLDKYLKHCGSNPFYRRGPAKGGIYEEIYVNYTTSKSQKNMEIH